MATKTTVELPTKRDYASDPDSGNEVPASKKAKAAVMGEEDVMVEEEEWNGEDEEEEDVMEEAEEEEEEEMEEDEEEEEEEESSGDASMWQRSDEMIFESESFDEFLGRLGGKENEDIVREFQIFWGSRGHSERANQVTSYKDARQLFTKAELTTFRSIYWDPRKWWHIRTYPTNTDAVGLCSTKLTDYELLAIYPSNNDFHSFHNYDRYYFTYKYDCAYLQYANELSQTIQWGSTLEDAQPIAEQIWEKHMPYVRPDLRLDLICYSAETAIEESNITQFKKELILLFADIYKRELDGMGCMQALKEVINENGLAYCPSNKDLIIEDALDKPGGSIWYKYHGMKRFCNFEKGEALEYNMLKDRITNFIELCFEDSYGGDPYARYANEKIRFAKELKIL